MLVKIQGQVFKFLESILFVYGISFIEWLVMYCLYQLSDYIIKCVLLVDVIGVMVFGVMCLLLFMEKVGWVECVINVRDVWVSLVRFMFGGLEVYQ